MDRADMTRTNYASTVGSCVAAPAGKAIGMAGHHITSQFFLHIFLNEAYQFLRATIKAGYLGIDK